MSKNKSKTLSLLLILLAISACVSSGQKQAEKDKAMLRRPTASQIRDTTALPLEVYADTITVQQFRRVCDVMARDLVLQAFVTRSARPPVITIRKLQNKTGSEIDEQIFQETIRVKLIENARGSVLFRDDESYQDIIEERARQSSGEVSVTLTDTVVTTQTADRVKEREFDGGSLSGSFGKGEGTINVERETKKEMTQSASVKSRVASADYFLRGIIYQVKERHANRPEEGMAYFQYQFRVTDARSGLIVWEKMVSSKMEGTYQAPIGGGTSSGGAAPAGWPQGQGTVGNVNPQQQPQGGVQQGGQQPASGYPAGQQPVQGEQPNPGQPIGQPPWVRTQ